MGWGGEVGSAYGHFLVGVAIFSLIKKRQRVKKCMSNTHAYKSSRCEIQIIFRMKSNELPACRH